MKMMMLQIDVATAVMQRTICVTVASFIGKLHIASTGSVATFPLLLLLLLEKSSTGMGSF